MSSNAKWVGLLPELETADGRFPQAEPEPRHDQKRCNAAFGKACRFVQAVIRGIKKTAHLIERSLTTFAVLEILGILLMIVVLQL